MRPVLRAAESIWKNHGRPEGVTVTAGTDGTHGATSWHYIGAALDLRTHYFSEPVKASVFEALVSALPDYDIILHSTHIHAEVGNALAKRVGIYF
jgi:hypothetical protein